MRNIIICFTTLIFLTTTSCATRTLWNKTDPDKWVEVSVEEVTEKELKEKGIEYIKSHTGKHYYVKRGDLTKIRDKSARVLLTPVTILIDAAIVIIVVGVIIIVLNAIDEAKKRGD